MCISAGQNTVCVKCNHANHIHVLLLYLSYSCKKHKIYVMNKTKHALKGWIAMHHAYAQYKIVKHSRQFEKKMNIFTKFMICEASDISLSGPCQKATCNIIKQISISMQKRLCFPAKAGLYIWRLYHASFLQWWYLYRYQFLYLYRYLFLYRWFRL